MASRVFRSPGGPDPDKAPWERTHPKIRAARRDAEAANRPAQAVLNRLKRARGLAGTDRLPEPEAPPSLELADGDADRFEETRADAFWGEAHTDDAIPAINDSLEFLSGQEDFFDPATGWDFNAITDSQIHAVEAAHVDTRPPAVAPPVAVARPAPVAQPVLDSGEFAIEIDDDEEHEPSPVTVGNEAAPITVDDALARAQDLFQLERDGDALRLLGVATRLAPNDPRLITWIEFGERRVMLRLCPTAALDRIPNLGHPLSSLLGAASANQGRVLEAIDGITNTATLRVRVGLEPVPFWTALGRLVERGWILWLDDA